MSYTKSHLITIYFTFILYVCMRCIWIMITYVKFNKKFIYYYVTTIFLFLVSTTVWIYLSLCTYIQNIVRYQSLLFSFYYYRAVSKKGLLWVFEGVKVRCNIYSWNLEKRKSIKWKFWIIYVLYLSEILWRVTENLKKPHKLYWRILFSVLEINKVLPLIRPKNHLH